MILRLIGVSRVANIRPGDSLEFYFNRAVTDDELRAIHDTMREYVNGVGFDNSKNGLSMPTDLHKSLDTSEAGAKSLVVHPRDRASGLTERAERFVDTHFGTGRVSDPI